MTSPGRYRSEPPDLIETINQLKRRVDALENNPRIGNTAIDTGTLRVKDANGIVRVELGLLMDGTYGLSVKETEDDETFHQVPYLYTDFVTSPSGDTCSSAVYGDLANFGPSVTVPIRSTGTILVVATAQMQTGTGAAATNVTDGRFDVEFSGANTRVPVEADDPLVGLDSRTITVSAGNNLMTFAVSITSQATFEELNAGSTTITMKYRRSAGATSDPQFFRRGLSVFNL